MTILLCVSRHVRSVIPRSVSACLSLLHGCPSAFIIHLCCHFASLSTCDGPGRFGCALHRVPCAGPLYGGPSSSVGTTASLCSGRHSVRACCTVRPRAECRVVSVGAARGAGPDYRPGRRHKQIADSWPPAAATVGQISRDTAVTRPPLSPELASPPSLLPSPDSTGCRRCRRDTDRSHSLGFTLGRNCRAIHFVEYAR